MLFVRGYKKEDGVTSPYFYLGPVNYVSYIGTRPMNIIWSLEREMLAALVKKVNKMIVG